MAAGDAGARKRRRLTRSGEFDRVYREGASSGGRHLVLYRFSRPEDAAGDPRLGVSVGRKVGGAVQRNKVKRLLREAFWQLGEEVRGGHDFVLVARPDLADVCERDGLDGVRRLLEEALADLPSEGRST